MLSRSAQGLYWTGPLSRAGRASLPVDGAPDRGTGGLQHRDDRPAVAAALCQHPARAGRGELEPSPEDDAYIFADAYTLADDLTFEPQNPDSIGACVANARENIRQVRNAVSREMWGSLNTAYLELYTRRIEDIWVDRTEEFYKRTENAVRTIHRRRRQHDVPG